MDMMCTPNCLINSFYKLFDFPYISLLSAWSKNSLLVVGCGNFRDSKLDKGLRRGVLSVFSLNETSTPSNTGLGIIKEEVMRLCNSLKME